MQSECCGCRTKILDENSKNIYNENLDLDIHNNISSFNDGNSQIKLHSAIELIIGQKVSKTDNLPQKICGVCLKKLKDCISFRTLLLSSRDAILNSLKINNQSSTVQSSKSFAGECLTLHSNLKTKDSTNNKATTVLNSLSLTTIKQDEILIARKTPEKNLIKQLQNEDLINIEDNSMSPDINNSLINKFQNDQENNNCNDSETEDNIIISSDEKSNKKHIDYDIESEIDVCSGEEDDVLELDVQKSKGETVEINSSSESDIEVCDYEPTGKRGNYNTYTPPIKF